MAGRRKRKLKAIDLAVAVLAAVQPRKETVPKKRLYDDKRKKRQVFVMITTWRGVAAFAKHYYAEVHEDENPILKKGMLVYESDDEECQGRTFGGIMETSFSSYHAAIDWAVEIIREHFPTSTHKVFDCSGLVTLKEIKQALTAKGE